MTILNPSWYGNVSLLADRTADAGTGAEHATQGFQPGLELRSNRFLRFEEAKLNAKMTRLP